MDNKKVYINRMTSLFQDNNGNIITDKTIKEALIEIGADRCDTLFIHSDVMFGTPVRGLRRKEFLGILYDQVQQLNVKNIVVPTFTYSFPNHEVYDIEKSKTSMGAFNEFIRKMEGRYRTDDPLLSVSVPEALKTRFDHVGNHSLGAGSAFDVLHQMDDVKFLFFGAEMAECFTYVHYVEKMMDVPYRFDMPFEGDVIYPGGTVTRRKQFIHTQCRGAVLPQKYLHFEREMQEKGYLKKKMIADKYIGCISEKDAYREIRNHIDNNIYYFLERPFKREELVHEYTYNTDNGRITHC